MAKTWQYDLFFYSFGVICRFKILSLGILVLFRENKRGGGLTLGNVEMDALLKTGEHPNL